jgi:GNAT superfamily N-acetyltransferase
MVDIRRVTADEWPILSRVRLTALREAPYAFGSTYEREAAFTEQDWLGRMSRAAYFVAWEHGPGIDPSGSDPGGTEPVGLAGGFAPSGRPDAREIVAMWVVPGRRGGKLADLLLSTVLDWARDGGAAETSLWVGDGNEPARRFFVRYGYRPTGQRQPLWGHPGVEAAEYRLAF